MVKTKYKKVFVIGSNSFSAGSLIYFLLLKKFKVIGISRSKINKKNFLRFNASHKNFSFYKADINTDLKKIKKLINSTKPDYIINFASQSMVGQSWDTPLDWFYTNSYSMIDLYDFLSRLKFKFKLVHISTPEVYGNIKNYVFENNIFNPTTPYAASRVTADHFLQIINQKRSFNYNIIRASNVYGEYQRIYRIIPKVIYCILKNKKIKLDGGGISVRNFIHIDDVSKATIKIMQQGKKGHVYHIAGDKLISIKNLTKLICEKMSYNFKKLIKPGPERIGKDKYYKLSNKKIKKEFKWEQKISLDNGIQKCIIWMKDNIHLFVKNDENYVHKK
jgi:dTDP-glucose 4,6-dehydratase